MSQTIDVGSRLGQQNMIGHPAWCHGRLMYVPVLSSYGVSKTLAIVHYNGDIFEVYRVRQFLSGGYNLCVVLNFRLKIVLIFV